MIRRTAAVLVLTLLSAGCTSAPAPSGRAQTEPTQPVTPAPTQPAKEPVAGSKTANDRFRALAEKSGGEVQLDYDGPGTPIVGAKFLGNKLTDADLAALEPLDTLRSLDLIACDELSATGMRELKRFPNLETLFFPLSARTRPGLEVLGRLNKLKTLWFSPYANNPDTHVTDADIPAIKAVKQLRELHCPAFGLTDAGVKDLTNLPELEILNLGSYAINTGKQITDEGLTQLKALPKLREFTLLDSQITDAGLKHIGQLRQLKSLNLSAFLHSNITDTGMKELERLNELETLDLSGTRVTDAGLKSIKALGNLKDLRISNMPITDAGLSELRVCKSLKKVTVIGTKVTDAGVAELKKTVPGIEITR